MAAFATQYWLFVAARIGLGIAGSGVYHSSYTICKWRKYNFKFLRNVVIIIRFSVTEFAAPKYRSTMSIVFSVSYPIGMIILSITASFIQPWRHLQLALSLPALLLIIHYL